MSYKQKNIIWPVLLIAIVIARVVTTLAQGTTPERGVRPYGSYALSDIETISTSNANMMLNIPLAKLPAGRGGLAGALNLNYSSKLYDSHIEFIGWAPGGEPQLVERNILRPSDQGGWHYGIDYTLQIINRRDQFQLGTEPQYPNTEALYRWKLKMAFPDGSVHEFVPRDYNNHQQLQDGYYDLRPDGWRTIWNAGSLPEDTPFLNNTITYYSSDSSYLRLDIQHDSDNNYLNNPWTLYLPNGSRVTGGNAPVRITDRNNNYVEIRHITHNGHNAVQLIDQLGRDAILEYGFASQTDAVHVRGINGELLTTQIKWKTLQIYKRYVTSFEGNGSGYPDTLGLMSVVSEIILPAQGGGLKYTFNYNAADHGSVPFPTPSYGWGEISSITFPSGARANYTYALDGVNGPGPQGNQVSWETVLGQAPTRKDLVWNQEHDGSSTPVTETWLYSMNTSLLGNNGISSLTAPDGGVINEWIDIYGRIYKSQRADGTVVERVWQQNIPEGHPTLLITVAPAINSYLKTEFTSIRDSLNNLTKTAIKDYNYDKNGNVTAVREYDWVAYGSVPRDGQGRPTGVPAGAPLKRATINTYAAATPDAADSSGDDDAYYTPLSPQFRDAVIASEVSDGSSQVASRSEFFYDNPFTRGNLTLQKTWASAKGPYSNPLQSSNSISLSNEYDGYGNPILTTDARGFRTRLVYGSVAGFTDLYPTQINTAYQTAVQRTDMREYDFSTGSLTRITDADNNISTSTTYDVFGRPTLVRAAEGKPEEARTATEYSDVDRRVIVRADLNTVGDGKLVSVQHYDQLGRVRLSRQLEDSATQSATDETQGLKLQTRYIFNGSNSYTLTSNPYRATNSAAAGSEGTMGWNRAKTDNGGRVIEIQTFAGAGLPAPWGANATTTGTVSTTYDADSTTVADQVNRQRKSITDGLGRLIQIYEAPNDPGYNYLTSYSYDALDNLTRVSQGAQSRYFMYDSLKRLIRARNPEQGIHASLALADPLTGNSQWSFGYQYDDNGNLTQKTDARGVVSTYDYDGLNRTSTRIYSDLTPAVTYSYDSSTISNGKGRLASISSGVSTYSYSGYDAMGRPLSGAQTIGSQTYTLSYSYDLSGHVKTITYPSNRTVNLAYDESGRTSGMTGNLGGTPRNYTTGIIYDAGNRMTKEQFGTTTPIYNKLFYNSRGQLSEIREGTSYTGPTDITSDRGAIINYYSNQGGCVGASCNVPDNNGNLRRQEVRIPNSDNFMQFYEYDPLNRLESVRENKNGGAVNWQQAYTYDRYGNRSINGGATFGQNINNIQAAVVANTTTNRMYAPAETEASHPLMNYDPAGNQIRDYFTDSVLDYDRTYDAENRMTSVTTTSGLSNAYSYDGDGRRVVRNVNGVVTWQVYGLGGELLAEYAANTSFASPQKEYGYRNGQLLITASVTTGWGSPPVLHDNPLEVNETTVQARHITQLRDAINALRSHLAMPAYSWQTSATTNDWISANPILEMRTALDQALGAPSGGYSIGLGQGLPIRAIHIQELRDRVLGAWNSGGSAVDIRWMVSDHLGTPRIILDQSGSLATVSRHDYLPFGEELFAGTGGRTPALGYSNTDGARQKFTSKERDNETGLDYFGRRYYGSMQGRFTGTDPKPVTKESFLNPQRWNLYGYVNNNPLSAIDPNGGNGQGKGGDKVISVFLDYGVKDLGRKVTRDRETGKVMSDVPNTSDWQRTQAGVPKGVRVELYGDNEVTGNRGLPQPLSDRVYNNALKNSDVVIYVGHGRSTEPTREPFQQHGIQVGSTYYTTTGTGPAFETAMTGPGPFDGPKPDTAASIVVNLSCDADRNGGAYYNFVGENQVMVTINSRGDGRDGGITSFDAVDKAANAFVKTYAATGDVQKAVDSANTVLKSIPGNQQQNVGDEIKTKRIN